MEPEEKSNGTLIGAIVIIIILIIGGIYTWQSKAKVLLEEKQDQVNLETNLTDLDTLEQDLGEIDATIDLDLNTLQ